MARKSRETAAAAAAAAVDVAPAPGSPRRPSNDAFRTPKRGDLVVEEIKRWIVSRELKPGDRLPKEAELQEICTRIAKAWDDDDFPPTPNPLCGWCDFREMCPEGQEYQKDRDAVSGAQVDLPF